MKNNEIRHRLMHTPYILEDVYENLPPFLKELCSQFKPGRKRDVFLSSALVMLGGIMFKTKAQNVDEYYPHSFLSIVAPPASGKSAARHAKRLLDPLHDHIKMLGKNADITVEPPKSSRVFIPANISYAMFIKLLHENNGHGIIYEEEIDTLNKSLQQEWGNFSDELRRIYDNQAISYARKVDNVDIEITEPKLAMVITGTPGQIKTLIPSAENGLFSRMLFYCFQEEPEWENISLDSANLKQYFLMKGEAVKELYNFLQSKECLFSLTQAQVDDMNYYFPMALEDALYTHGYEVSSLVFRTSVHLIRLAMILSSIRKWDSKDESASIQCTDIDYLTARQLCHTYISHSLAMLEIIPFSEVREHATVRDKFYSNLSLEFKKCEAEKLGKMMSISPASVSRYLEKFKQTGWLESPKYGYYRKVVNP